MKKLLLLLLLAGPVWSQQRLDIDRLYTLPWIIGTAPKDFVWSADSQRLAFLWNDEGTNFMDVWMTDRYSGKPVRLTHVPRSENELDTGVAHLAWTPDQKAVLFIFQDRLYSVEPGGSPKIFVDWYPVKAVKTAPKGNMVAFLNGSRLSVVEAGSASHPKYLTNSRGFIEDFYWSSDGKTLAFIESDSSNVPEQATIDFLAERTTERMFKRPFPGETSEKRRLFFISAQGDPNIREADLGGDPMDLIFGVSRSPDSKTVLVDRSDLYIKDRRLLLIDPSTGHSSVLLREKDPNNVTAEWWSTWAPDGKGVYFTSDRDNFYHIYYEPLTGGEPKDVTKGDFAVFSTQLTPHSLFFASNQGHSEERQLYKLNLDNNQSTRITQLPGTHTPTVSPDGTIAADYFSNDLTPPDLYLQKLDNAQPEQQVTHSPLPEFSNYHWVSATYVTFPSTADGVTLHARLTLPPNFDKTKKYPAILGSVYSNTVHNQWGGRVAHPTWGLDQYLAQQGYILLNVDIRGSTGYGKAFRQRLALSYGSIDVEDLYSGVKFLESQGYVDMQRVGIWGSSYGGLLTTMSLFTKPGVYKAGVAGAPATSLFHALTGEMRTMMAPQDHKAEYEKASAFLKSDGLQDHLMIIHGMRDEIVLFKDSVVLEQRLIMKGKDVQLVVLPAAPHSWDTGPMVQTRYAYHQLIDFFKRYLGEGPS